MGLPAAEKIIRRVRDNNKTIIIPKSFSSVKNLGDYIKKNPSSLKFAEQNIEISIEAELIKDSENCYHLAIFDKVLGSKFTDKDNFLDGTFGICPEIGEKMQLLVLMAKKHDVVSTLIFFKILEIH